MKRWLFAWWFFAEAVVMRLTIPRPDAGAPDADVYDAVRASRLFSLIRAAVAACERAWAHSYVRRALDSIPRAGADASRAERLRQAGTCMAVAALTVLLLQKAESEPGPLRWFLPLVAGLAAVIMIVGADPLARAWEAKRRR
jgi:hypothetical protein